MILTKENLAELTKRVANVTHLAATITDRWVLYRMEEQNGVLFVQLEGRWVGSEYDEVMILGSKGTMFEDKITLLNATANPLLTLNEGETNER